MDETTKTTTETDREPPIIEQLKEERFMSDLYHTLDAWRKAGKPHKR